MVNLSRPCDACGKFIGGGFKHCPKCQIYFCFLCLSYLTNFQNKYPIECPMCGGSFSCAIADKTKEAYLEHIISILAVLPKNTNMQTC